MMHVVNISEAKSQLSSLIKNIEELDEEVIISRAGKPIARMIKYRPQQLKNRLNIYAQKIVIPKDFDEWPTDIAQALGIEP